MLPDGARVVDDLVSQAEESSLLEAVVESIDACDRLYRDRDVAGEPPMRTRVLRLGRLYHVDEVAESFPAWARDLAEMVRTTGVTDPIDSATACEYQPGHGISAHVDVPGAGDVLATVSLGADCVLRLERGEARVDVPLRRRSLCVLSRESRWSWTHAVLPIVGERARYSVVFRSVARVTR